MRGAAEELHLLQCIPHGQGREKCRVAVSWECCGTREAHFPVALHRCCGQGQPSALWQHVGEAGPQCAVLVGSDPAPGRAGHPPGICSCFLKTGPFIFLRLGLSTDGSLEAMAGGREGRGGCLLEKHLLRRHRGFWPQGQRWCEEGSEGKHRWCFVSQRSCGRRAVRGSWGNVGEVGQGHGREDAFGSV